MFLFEGAKVSKNLINNAVNDPDMTMGFEAEFFVTGADKLLMDLYDDDRKKLSDIEWHDILSHFDPLGIDITSTEDNQEIIKQRAAYSFKKMYPEVESPLLLDFKTTFEGLRKRYKPHHIITILGVYPRNGFSVSDTETKTLKRLIGNYNLAHMTEFSDLNNQYFYLDNLEQDVFSFNSTAREVLYQTIADGLRKYLNEDVVFVSDTDRTKSITNNYTSWGVTYDSSLEVRNPEGKIGVEIISPKKQIGDGINAMTSLLEALNNFSVIVPGLEAETTKETGFHVTIGVQNKPIDAVKLLFLMGDEYVAKNFKRLQHPGSDGYAAQTYQAMMIMAQTAYSKDIYPIIDRLQQNISLSKNDVDAVIAFFRSKIPLKKMQSVNLTKLMDGIVEFRSPGNANYEKDLPKILDTVRHIVVMMYIASNPAVYRKEYYKKLYTAAIRAGKEYLEKTGQDLGHKDFMKKAGWSA